MSSSESYSRILQALAEGTAAATGGEFFRSLAKHAALALGAKYAFAAETLSEQESRSLAYWEGSDFGEGFSYRFPGTPCQRVAQGHVCATATRLQQLYPEDIWLQQISAESYVGVPMKTASGKVLGHVAVLHTEPMEPSPEQIAALKVFAARGCAELERLQADRALQQSLREVERLRDQLQAENSYLQEEIQTEHNFEELVGNSPAWRRLLTEIEACSASDATVLILGETGTGKELIARALHSRSPRRNRPLVKVNSGAISAGLVESELFGHVKGAFTGALQKRVGRFELADRGTLFLDEIGELPVGTQVKLLRVLQEQEFEPIGSNTTVRVDVRVIAATNRDLEQAIASGQFRADLYYRLNVIPLRVPPLRERRSDIAQLAMYFMEHFARKFGRQVKGIATSTLERMLHYDWPGNVRELANLIERAVILSSGPVLHFEPGVLKLATAASGPHQSSAESASEASTGAHAGELSSTSEKHAKAPDVFRLEELEKRHILAVLERTRWVIEGPDGAAQLLGLNPSTTRSRMKKLGIKRVSHSG
jgi:transcriptional regulator with GAF, ATPase, and Fis domain